MPEKIIYFKWIDLDGRVKDEGFVSHIKYFWREKRATSYLYRGGTEVTRVSISYLRDKKMMISRFGGYWEEVEEAEFALL